MRLNALASLFDQGERCRSIALDLFYRLQPEEHEALFLGLSDYPNEREHLVTVIDGIYRTLDTVPEHDLRLMEIWLNVLQNAELPESNTLVASIRYWREGREFYLKNQSTNAANSYNNAIVQDHPVIYYDHALVSIKLQNYADALFDLNAIMQLVESATPTPTPEAMSTLKPLLTDPLTQTFNTLPISPQPTNRLLLTPTVDLLGVRLFI